VIIGVSYHTNIQGSTSSNAHGAVHSANLTTLLLNEEHGSSARCTLKHALRCGQACLTTAFELCSVVLPATQKKGTLKGVTQTVTHKVHRDVCTSPLQSWCGHQLPSANRGLAMPNSALPAQPAWREERSRLCSS
jgi:hypothetical protein